MEELGGNITAKPVGMALEEIQAGKVQIEFAPTTSDEEVKVTKSFDEVEEQ